MVEVLVLSTPGCGGCAIVKKMLEKIKKDMPSLKFKVIDVVEHPEYLQKYPILTVPGIVIKGKLEFMGVPKEEELRKKLK